MRSPSFQTPKVRSGAGLGPPGPGRLPAYLPSSAHFSHTMLVRTVSESFHIRLSPASDTCVRSKQMFSPRTDSGQQAGSLGKSLWNCRHLRVTHPPRLWAERLSCAQGRPPAMHTFLAPLHTEHTDLSVSQQGLPSLARPAGERHPSGRVSLLSPDGQRVSGRERSTERILFQLRVSLHCPPTAYITASQNVSPLAPGPSVYGHATLNAPHCV